MRCLTWRLIAAACAQVDISLQSKAAPEGGGKKPAAPPPAKAGDKGAAAGARKP